MVRRLISVQPNHRFGCEDDVQWGGGGMVSSTSLKTKERKGKTKKIGIKPIKNTLNIFKIENFLHVGVFYLKKE